MEDIIKEYYELEDRLKDLAWIHNISLEEITDHLELFTFPECIFIQNTIQRQLELTEQLKTIERKALMKNNCIDMNEYRKLKSHEFKTES